MSTDLTIALVQHVSSPGDVDACLARFAHYAEQAQASGAQLLLFPEASLCGYNNSLEVNEKISVEAQSEATNTIATLCKKHELAIAYGFAERDGDKLFNSMQLIDAEGKAQALYRKTHLWGEQDRTLFSEGEDLIPIIECLGWRIGMLICYDIEFPENVRRLAIEGAELILTPTALMSPFTMVADYVVPVRAYENQLYIAYANYCGNEYEQEYVGHSSIVGPDGVALAKASDQETMLLATLTKSRIKDNRAALPYHRDRRPALYTPLTKVMRKQ